MSSLKKQTFSGVIWTLADTFLLKGSFFAATIILARILGPTEFGLLGMISIFIAIGVSLVDSGLSSSLIRTKDADEFDNSSVFWMNLGMSVLVYFILYLSAPYIAMFYKQELLTSVIRLYCLSFVISALSAVQLALLAKDMQFKKIMRMNIPGTVIGITVGIVMGYLDYGVWSLIAMYLVTQAVQSCMLWIFSSWKPKAIFSVQKARFHYKFGYKLMLSSLLDTVFKNIYNVIIGKFYLVQSLGYYERAKSLNDYPVTTLTGIIAKVTYPLLVKIQDDKEKISLFYKQLLQFTFFITAPLMLGASAAAKPLILLILGVEWLPAVPYFQILCFAGILYPIHAFNINILMVYGRSDLFLKLEIMKKVITVICISIMFNFGLMGLVWSSVITSCIGLVINTHFSKEMIDYPPKRQFLDMVPTLVCSVVMFGIMSFFVKSLSSFPLYFQLLITSLVGFLCYLIINFMIKSPSLFFAIKLIKERKL